MPRDQSATAIETPYDLSPASGVSVEVDPVLGPHGYGKAPARDSQKSRWDRSYVRQNYWTEGEGARRFLQEVADTLNASPHLKLQPFEVSMTWGIKAEIVARLTEWIDQDEAHVTRIILDYADEVGLGLLAEMVREQRWQNLERVGREPVPLNRPTYTGGQSHRAGPFDYVVGRTSPAVAQEQLARFRLENPWVK
jgi:hypothetical protein